MKFAAPRPREISEALCLPHLSTVAHNCHDRSINLGKKKNLTAKRITSPCGIKKKTRGKKKNLTAKKEKTQSKKKISRQKEDLRQNSSIPRDILILIPFAVRLFFLPWGFSFCHEVNSPFPSSLVPLFQSESKCKTILMKMTLICLKMKLHAEFIFTDMNGSF